MVGVAVLGAASCRSQRLCVGEPPSASCAHAPHPTPNPHHTHLQTHTACIEVSNLCSNHFHRELLREAGAIEAVFEAILTFPNSLKVQFAGVQAIANLSAGTDQARLRMCAAGAGRVLVQCLVRFSQDQALLMATWGAAALPQCEELRSLCVMAMAHLLQVEDNMIPLLEAGTWEIVVRSMANFSGEEELQLWGCRILATLAEGLNKSGAANTAAIEIIMKRTPACQVVVAASGRILNNLVAADGLQLQLTPALQANIVRGAWLTSCALAALASISQENATQLVGLGACQQVEQIMRLCMDESVAEWGARALAEIALSIRGGAGGSMGAPGTNAHGRLLRGNAAKGGCQAVMNAMNHFSNSTGVQFAGCYAIANLAGESRENQLLFYDLNAAQSVSRALDLFPADANIQEWGTRAFAELAAENSHNQMAILDAAGCSALVGALAAFPHVPRVQFAACYAIVNLTSTNAHCRKRLGEAGACRHIEKGMSGPCAVDSNVMEWACRALGDLANSNVENQTKIRTTGGCRQVVQALANFPDYQRTQFAGCYALTHLVAGNRANQIHVGEVGGCERIVQAIVDYPKDSNVRAWGFRALIALAAKSAIATQLMDAGSLFDMVKVLKESNYQHEQGRRAEGVGGAKNWGGGAPAGKGRAGMATSGGGKR